MKLCEPCNVKLFDGATECGICGNDKLTILSSPKPDIEKADKKETYDGFYDGENKEPKLSGFYDGENKEPKLRTIKEDTIMAKRRRRAIRQAMNPFSSPSFGVGAIAQPKCKNCPNIVNSSGNYCSKCHTEYRDKQKYGTEARRKKIQEYKRQYEKLRALDKKIGSKNER